MAFADPVGAGSLAKLIIRSRFLSAFGDGLYFVIIGIYLLNEVGLNAFLVAVFLSAAVAIAAVLSIAMGYILNALPLRLVLFWMSAMGAVAIAVLPLQSSGIAILSLLILFRSGQRVSFSILSALIPMIIAEDQRLSVRGRTQRAFNLGMAFGAALGGFFITFEAAYSYTLAFAIVGIFYILSAFAVHVYWIDLIDERLRTDRIKHNKIEVRALKDRRFLSFTLLFSVLLFNVPIVDIVLPVWIISSTNAPIWVVPAVLVLNTMVIIAFQNQATSIVRRSKDTPRLLLTASYLVGLSFIFYMLSAVSSFGPLIVLGVLFVATVTQAFGELLQFSAGWEISYQISDEEHHAQYQSLFSVAMPIAEIFAPLLIVSAISYGKEWGWVGIAILFILTGHLLARIARARQ